MCIRDRDGTPTARTGKILNNTPMDRFGEVEELIGSVLFLACEEASGFVNGACIPIDGAFAAYSGVYKYARKPEEAVIHEVE